MRVVKPQSLLVNFTPTQWGLQAQMRLAVGVGFRLSDVRILSHETSVWEALRTTPCVSAMTETGMPKQYAEWLLAGHTRCVFPKTETGVLRDWTAQVGLHKSLKKISAQGQALPSAPDLALASLSVDHSQSVRGDELGGNPRNPAGCAQSFAPLQLLRWYGPESDALAGMTPIDLRWPERRQWMPSFASTLEGMAEDGSHMGWPEHTDKRYFQQAAPDQWSREPVWPQGASFELRGFGASGAGFAGHLPNLQADVIVLSGGVHKPIALEQQTVWFLPDHDLGVIWWSGHVNLKHPLDDSLTMMVLALRDTAFVPCADELLAYAKRRTQLKPPDLAAHSDLPLMPALSSGWAWEQILSEDQHPRDRHVILSYEQLRVQIVDEEKRRTEVASQFDSQEPSTSSPLLPMELDEVIDPLAWMTRRAQATGQHLKDEIFTRQNFQGSDWSGWTLTNIQFENCLMDCSHWNDCIFEQVDFIDSTCHQLQMEKINWSRGSMARCNGKNVQWHQVALSHVRFAYCEFTAMAVDGGLWRHVVMDACQWPTGVWQKLSTENFVAMKCNLDRLKVTECQFEKLNMLETDAHQSQWMKSRLSKAVFVDKTLLGSSMWEDCDCKNMYWNEVTASLAQMRYCTFTDFNASGTQLDSTTWSHCNLNDAQLLNANLSQSVFERTSLRGAVMSGAMLPESRVTHCNLIRLNTANAVHARAGLWRKNLEGGAVMHPRRQA